MATVDDTEDLSGLERNIVVTGSAGDRCGLEIPFVYRDVTAPG
jgi:hypothetical protein